MAVEVVDAEQLELDGSGAVLLGTGVQAQQGDEEGGGKRGRPRQQVAAVDASHGRKVWSICRAFVADSCRLREVAVKGYNTPMRVLDCDCGQTLQAANDDDLTTQVRAHVDESHPEMGMTDEQVRDLVANRAYDASDS